MATIQLADAEWLTARQAGVVLGVSRETVYGLIRKGKFTVSRLEGFQHARLLASEVHAYLAASISPATSGPVAELNRAS